MSHPTNDSAWIAEQEALREADGCGAEQPDACDALDPYAGLAVEPLAPEELDRAVAHAEQAAYRGEALS